MTPDSTKPGVMSETVGIDDLDSIDLTIEKLGPRLALDQTEGGASYPCAGQSCSLTGKG